MSQVILSVDFLLGLNSRILIVGKCVNCTLATIESSYEGETDKK